MSIPAYASLTADGRTILADVREGESPVPVAFVMREECSPLNDSDVTDLVFRSCTRWNAVRDAWRALVCADLLLPTATELERGRERAEAILRAALGA